jgi:hypothetical protein
MTRYINSCTDFGFKKFFGEFLNVVLPPALIAELDFRHPKPSGGEASIQTAMPAAKCSSVSASCRKEYNDRLL